MTHSKKVCKILKEIRQQIADKNDIALIISECHFQGECKGTCPKCEVEVRFLENELNKRRQLGKAVAIAGISLGMMGNINCFAQQVDTVNSVANDTILTEQKEFDTSPCSKDVLRGFVEKMPEPVGGFEAMYKFLQNNLIYPAEAKEKKIEGKVFVEFIIEKDGSVTHVKILKSVDPELDEEAVRIVKMMPKWIPGEQMGKPIRTCYQIPIRFTLQDEKKNKKTR